tara:strand:- start:98 stop:343 length:246 start_codon:yes stop_codon:yes gene_type:complete
MSSEVHKYIEKSLDERQNLFDARLLNFPNDKKINSNTDLIENNSNYWEITDKSNDDQLKAVIGICFMFGSLILIGLCSNFL